jgi:hypothetical protein
MVYNWNIFNEEKKISRDKYNYLLSYIHVGQYTNRSRTNRWVPLNQSLLQDVFKDGSKYLKYLLKNDYIECDGEWKRGFKSLSYRINYSKVPKKGIKVYDNKYYNKTIKLIEGTMMSKIDHKTKLILEYTKMFFNQGDIKFKDVNSVNKILGRYRRENLDRWNSQKVLVDKILIGDITVGVDKQGARVYTNYSNLSKELREYLVIDGKRKVCLDISNSQWQTLCLTLKGMNPLLESKFLTLTHSGKLYEYFLERSPYSDIKDYDEKRNKVKRDMLNWLYAELYVCSNKESISYIERIMKSEFREIWDMLYSLKSCKDGGSKLAKNMQLKESTIIKDIQYALLNKGIKCISLHDSFYFSYDTSNDILDWVEWELIKAGYTSIKREYDIKETTKQALLLKNDLKERYNKEVVNKYLGKRKEKSHIDMIPKNNNIETSYIKKRKSDELLISKRVNLDDYLNEISKDLFK